MHLPRTWAALAACQVFALGAASAASGPALLLEDSFDHGTIDPAWVSVQPTQWVEDGWLHQQDRDGWPRDALLLAHDGDPAWRDYRVALSVDFADGTPWEHANVVLRADGFRRSSGGGAGTGYELQFTGNAGWPPSQQDRISLTRTDLDRNSHVTLFDAAWALPSHPFLVEVTLQGDRIELRLDEVPVFSVVDPDPLPYGGVGLHTIWESHARFDSVRITSAVPEAPAAWMLALGLPLLGAWRRRERSSAGPGQ